MKKTGSLVMIFSSLLILSACGPTVINTTTPPPTEIVNNEYLSTSTPSTSTPNNLVTSSPTSTATSTPRPETVNVSIRNFAFSPATITIKKGTIVTWTNYDSTLHEISSNDFKSSKLNTGQTFSYIFDETGTFDYTCAIHPSMKGQVKVTE